MKKDSTSELKARIALLENVLESLPVGIMVLDRKGRILLTNQAQEKMSAIARENFLGDFFHEKWKDYLERGGPHEQYWTLLNSKKPFDFVAHDIIPQFYDTKVSGLCAGAPLSDGQGSVLLHYFSEQIKQDKYTLSRLAQNLAEAKGFLQNLVDSSLSAIFTVMRDGTIRTANKTAGKIFGCSLGSLIWQPISSLFVDKLKIDALTTTESGTAGIEKLCLRNGSEPFAARVLVSELQGGGDGQENKLITITDISRQKTLEERLKVSEKLAIYSELIAGIFHQINNPLVGVVNFSALLLEKVEENNALRPMVETIYDAARQCQNLIATLMKGFREPESTFRGISLAAALENAIGEIPKIQNDGADNKVVLIRKIEENLPDIKGDELQLGQVFQNLINNAFQAMPEGGALEVSTQVDDANHEVSVRFSDTGCGISQENLAKIFTPFFSTKINTGGGLGLSFCFQAIKNHGGRIEVESSAGKGCKMTVIFPFDVSNSESSEAGGG